MEAPPPQTPVIFRCCPKPTEALIPVKLVQNEYYENVDQGVISLSRFVKDAEMNIQTKKLIPKLRNFTLISWTIYDEHFTNLKDENATDMNKRFWRICGPNIKILTLTNCKIPYCFTVLSLLFWRAVRKLRRLTLLNCEMEINSKVFFTTSNDRTNQIKLIDSQLVDVNAQIAYYSEQLANPENFHRQAELTALLNEREGIRKGLNVERKKVGRGADTVYSFEDHEMRAELLENCSDLASTPTKLRYLEIENLTAWRGRVLIEWSKDANIFPKLKYLKVRQQNSSALEIPNVASLEKVKLKEVDLMNFSSDADKLKCETLLRLSTKRLSFDCGYKTHGNEVSPLLEHKIRRLEKLCMFRAPVDGTYHSFPSSMMFVHLTACHLWGNVAKDLNLFKLMPCLEKLKWITNCYEHKTHGVRLHSEFGLRPHLLEAESIVQETEDNFILESVKMFQLETGQLSVNSLEKLGRWLPNVKAFKATFIGHDKLSQIGKQWPKLEHLELAHGSLVTAEEILDVIETQKAFQSLKSFTWKGCACFVGFLKEEELSAISKLRATCGENVVHPWTEQGFFGGNCIRVLFHKALSTGERDCIDEFKRALNALN